MRLDPLIEDTLAALVAVSVLGVVVAGMYWFLTGISPWPYVVLGETGGLLFGVAVTLHAIWRGSGKLFDVVGNGRVVCVSWC